MSACRSDACQCGRKPCPTPDVCSAPDRFDRIVARIRAALPPLLYELTSLDWLLAALVAFFIFGGAAWAILNAWPVFSPLIF